METAGIFLEFCERKKIRYTYVFSELILEKSLFVRDKILAIDGWSHYTDSVSSYVFVRMKIS